MDQHTDSRGEHRSVGDDVVLAVEAEMSDPEMDEWMNSQLGPVEAAPSTDEGEAYKAPAWSAGSDHHEARALHQRASEARRKLRYMCDEDPYLIVSELEDAVRSLARAPLEERIRALQGTNYRCEEMCEAAQYGGSCRCSHLFSELPAEEEQIQKLEDSLRFTFNEMCESEAENERLREALTPFAELMSQSWEERQDEHPVYSFDGKAFTYGDVRRAVRLLATSSTEADSSSGT